MKVASFNSARRIALVGFITLFLPSLIAIGSGLADFTKKNLDVVQAKVEDNTQALKLKPNIYFIVLDMYARQDVLKDQLRIDNSEFLKGMEARGFVVDRQSFSNYPTTPLTLSTSFNMDFYSFSKDYSVDLILGHSPVVTFLKKRAISSYLLILAATRKSHVAVLKITALDQGISMMTWRYYYK